jgi:uncharacterized membrane protein (DUF441 family)
MKQITVKTQARILEALVMLGLVMGVAYWTQEGMKEDKKENKIIKPLIIGASAAVLLIGLDMASPKIVEEIAHLEHPSKGVINPILNGGGDAGGQSGGARRCHGCASGLCY